MTKTATLIVRLKPELKEAVGQSLNRINRYIIPNENMTFTKLVEDYLTLWVDFNQWLYNDRKKHIKALMKKRPRLSQAGFYLLFENNFLEYLKTEQSKKLKEIAQKHPEEFEEYKQMLKEFNKK